MQLLRCHVLGSANHGLGQHVLVIQVLADAEVRQLDVAQIRQQDVLRL